MTEVQTRSTSATLEGEAGDERERKLPLYDWILLPALSLVTICLMFALMKSMAGRMFSASGNLQQKCMSFDDPATGAHGLPNTVCTDKLSEVPQIEYRFNSCGHRAGIECGLKSPGTYRIVMTGSSFGFGLGVTQEETFAALLPSQLSKLTGRKIELYNESMLFKHPHVVALSFDEVLAAKPDMILWILTPYDVKEASLVLPPKLPKRADPDAPGADASYLTRVKYDVKVSFAGKSVVDGIHGLYDKGFAQFEGGLAALMLQHYLYESQRLYVNAYLKGGDGDRDTVFLRTNPPAEFNGQLQQFDGYAADIEARAKAAGVPLVAVLIPQRGQAAMISMGEWPSGYDPYRLNDQLRSIVTSHGGSYIDILPDFRTTPNPERYFLPVNGHPYSEGHAIISAFLAKELTNGAVPALQAGVQQQTALAQGK